MIDKMLQNAIISSSSHGRFQMYRSISQYLQDQAIIIPLSYMDHSNILSNNIAGTSDNFLFNPFTYLSHLYKVKP